MLRLLSSRTIYLIRLCFNALFVLYIVVGLAMEAVYSLPDKYPFFLTSDAVENFVCASFAYSLLYVFSYAKLRLQLLQLLGLLMFFGFLLLVMSSLKYQRIQNLEFSMQLSWVYFNSFVGLSALFLVLILIFNHLEWLLKHLAMDKELQLAQEQLLKRQLHPHFVFNAFNSLYSMALVNHKDTAGTTLKLAGIMRYITDESMRQRVSLEQEVKFIQSYVEIEKVRFGTNAAISIQVSGNIHNKQIAPLLLMTLVENAFKHGFYTNDSSAFVNIELHVEDLWLKLKVCNSKQKKKHYNTDSREGRGLANFEQRLQISYPRTSTYTAKRDTSEYTAILQLKLEQL